MSTQVRRALKTIHIYILFRAQSAANTFSTYIMFLLYLHADIGYQAMYTMGSATQTQIRKEH